MSHTAFGRPLCRMAGVRDPDRREFAGAVQAGQGQRVPPVGLDPLARPLRDQRRRDHDAVVPERGDLALQPVAGRSGLVGEGQPPVPLGEFADQALDRRGRAVDLAEEADFAVAPRRGHRDRDLQLRRIQTDVGLAILPHGSSPVHRGSALAHPAQPSLVAYRGTSHRSDDEHTVCQVGVFLGYASRHQRALIDRALYLPERWIGDPARCAAAGIPTGLALITKPQLGLAMLDRALEAGVPFAWLTGDSVYGADHRIRRRLEARQRGYVLAVTSGQRLGL